MKIEFGKRYERAQEESPEQFMGALHEFCKPRLHGLVLQLELATDRPVVGVIDSTDPRGVTLERPDETQISQFSADQIVAFTLADEPPIDYSDELRSIE